MKTSKSREKVYAKPLVEVVWLSEDVVTASATELASEFDGVEYGIGWVW